MKTVLLISLALTACAQELELKYLPPEQLKEWVLEAPAKNADRMEKLRSHFRSVGCEPIEQKVKGSKLPNLLCEIPGPEDAIIVIGAHYDKVAQSQGVIDNWTGATILPAIYQAIKPPADAIRTHKVIFAAFAAEEEGLVGSRSYVGKMPKGDREHYQAMINIDSVGASPVKIWGGGRNDPRLTQLLEIVAQQMKMKIGNVNLDKVGMGDSFPFREKQIRSIDFHSLDADTWKLLHTPNDNAKALKFDDYWETYRLLGAYVAYLDRNLTPAPPKPQ